MKHWPDFFLIGAMKAGTTNLYTYLSMNPKISMALPKEPGYFSRNERFAKGAIWYESRFQKARHDQVWGDASTCYSRSPFYPSVPERIFQVQPDAKFLYVVRDPTKRAYSHYKHQMEEAKIKEEPIVSYKDFLETDKEVLIAGKYYYQIKKFIDQFGIDNVHVCTFDDLILYPDKTLNNIYTFLGLDAFPLPQKVEMNRNASGTRLANSIINKILKRIRKIPLLKQILDVIPDSIRGMIFSAAKKIFLKIAFGKKFMGSLSIPDEQDVRFLAEYYKEDTIKLQKLTGLDLSNWVSFKEDRI